MGNNEIYIDGVDVAECGYFCEADNECSICGMGTDGEDTFCKNCKDNSNCYYKQLKRLEQENARLKEETIHQRKLNQELIIKYVQPFAVPTLNTELFDKNYKLSQTLQEIKAIAESCITKDACYECKYSDDCYIEDAEIPTYDICKLLIQKITKAEEE